MLTATDTFEAHINEAPEPQSQLPADAADAGVKIGRRSGAKIACRLTGKQAASQQFLVAPANLFVTKTTHQHRSSVSSRGRYWPAVEGRPARRHSSYWAESGLNFDELTYRAAAVYATGLMRLEASR